MENTRCNGFGTEHTLFMAGIRSSTRKMYTHVNDTDAPGSKKSNKKFRLTASSAVRGVDSLYDSHVDSFQASHGSSLKNP